MCSAVPYWIRGDATALPPGMKPEVHWLANYVMLSRATSIEGLLILRLATREQLTVGAPQYLKDEIDRLLTLEKKSVQQLRARLSKLEDCLSKDTLEVFADLFQSNEIGRLSHAEFRFSKPADLDSKSASLTSQKRKAEFTIDAPVVLGDGANVAKTFPQTRRRLSKKTPSGLPGANAGFQEKSIMQTNVRNLFFFTS